MWQASRRHSRTEGRRALTRNNVRVIDWSASHDPTSSDHALISFGIVAKNDVRVEVQDTVKRYNWQRTDWVQFRETLRKCKNERQLDIDCPNVDISSRALMEVLTQACEELMKAGAKRKRKPPPWWNDMLDRELSSLGRWKAKMRNARTAIAKRAIRKALSRRKVIHKRHCFKARRTAWRKFVTDAGNKDPWGPVFKWLKKGGTRPSKDIPVALRKSDGTYTTSLRETGERLLETLVPGDDDDNENIEQIVTRVETGVRVVTFQYASEDSGHRGRG